jgi:hypothetical protein
MRQSPVQSVPISSGLPARNGFWDGALAGMTRIEEGQYRKFTLDEHQRRRSKI